jgi:endonuclease/exonuclease/phosphatase (EEP) superfamily protein YafD
LIHKISEGTIEEIDEPRLKMLVWNVAKAKKKKWISDFRSLLPGVNFVLLQEATDQKKMISEFNACADFAWTFAFNGKSQQYRYGVLIGSPFIAKKTFFIRSPVLEPLLKTDKMALGSTYAIKERILNLLIINIHAINFRSLKAFKSHINAIKKVIEHHEGPLIFAGDFNSWSSKRLNFLYKTIEEIGLEAVRWDNRPFTIWGMVLDHVFIRGVKLERAKFLHKIKSSDHKPMILEFSLF